MAIFVIKIFIYEQDIIGIGTHDFSKTWYNLYLPLPI